MKENKNIELKTAVSAGKIAKEIVSLLLYLVGIVILTIGVTRYVGQRTVVDGSSMEPAFTHGDNLIIDKISYRFREPERFDVIVFPDEEIEDKYYIKRIIGLPQETVRIDEDGYIYINGEVLEESYGLEVMESPGLAYKEITLSEDEYFVLGDNRNNSSDSRDMDIGNVDKDKIIGRAWLRIYPFEEFGFVKHK